MTPKDYVRFALKNKGISQRELAASLGEKAQVVNQQLNRQNDLSGSLKSWSTWGISSILKIMASEK